MKIILNIVFSLHCLYLFLFFLPDSFKTANIILIPIKTYHPNISPKTNKEKYFQDLFVSLKNNYIYFSIEIGTPPKPANILITSDFRSFFFKPINVSPIKERLDIIKNKYYNFFKSSSRKIISDDFTSEDYEDMSFGGYAEFYVEDCLSLYKDINQIQKVEINNFPFMYLSSNTEQSSYGTLGLGLTLIDGYMGYYFLNSLKNKKIINKEIWTIKYDKDNPDQGFLIIGEEPHNYDFLNFNVSDNSGSEEKFRWIKKGEEKEENLRYSNPTNFFMKNKTISWSLKFNEIFYNENDENIKTKSNKKIKITEGEIAELKLDLNNIIGTEDYRREINKSFFEPLINKNICYIKSHKSEFIIYICNSNEFSAYKNKFPSLHFFSKQLNDEFILSYKDLFTEEINDEIIFLVFFPTTKSSVWELGKIFLKKYDFVFETDNKLIGYYLPENEKEKKILEKINDQNLFTALKENLLFLIIIGILIIIMIILGILAGRKKSKNIKNERKRLIKYKAEFEYNYDYDSDYQYFQEEYKKTEKKNYKSKKKEEDEI